MSENMTKKKLEKMNQPSIQPANQSPSQTSTQAAIQPSKRPASQAARQPSSQASSQPASQAASQPAQQTAKRPASRAASQPASQPTSQLPESLKPFFRGSHHKLCDPVLLYLPCCYQVLRLKGGSRNEDERVFPTHPFRGPRRLKPDDVRSLEAKSWV